MKVMEAVNYQDMNRKAANIISAQVILFPKSVLSLATGSTPIGIYKQLIEWYWKGDLDFSKISSVNLDEYCGIAPENPQSYHYYMEHNFFGQINEKQENIFVPDGIAENIETEYMRYDHLISKQAELIYSFWALETQAILVSINRMRVLTK